MSVNNNSKQVIVYILLMLTVLGWGLSWPAGSVVADALPPIFAAFVRFSIALPIFIITALVLERGRDRSHIAIFSKSMQLKFAVFGVLQVSLYNLFFFSGLQYTSSSDATLIIATNPTITAIFAAIYHKDEKLSKPKMIGLLTALSGVIIIVISSPNDQFENRILGDVIILFAAITWATFTTLSRPVLREFNSPITFTAWITLYGWFFLLIGAIFVDPTYFNWNIIISQEPLVLRALVFLAIVAAVFGNIAFNIGVQVVGSSKSAIFVNFVPIFGIFFSVVLLEDKFSGWYIVSLILIIFGVYQVNRNRLPKN